MQVVLTGGLGYIGSHTAIELIKNDFEVIIIDDLSNSNLDVLKGIESISGVKPKLEIIDLKKENDVKAFFKTYLEVSSIIHFAAYKAVGESVEKPLEYYQNNIIPLLHLLDFGNHSNQLKFIYSSSCTVYGQADQLPITEQAPIKTAESPYGNTKQIGEEILMDLAKSNPAFQAISLRYFNPIGAHKSAKIGELPLGKPQNLVPFITQTAMGIYPKLTVFGDDYPTRDGTCIRDYIYVVDLAKAHVKALQRLIENNDVNYEVFNLGTGTGSSVLEVIKSFEKVSHTKLNYEIGSRRPGDVTAAYADPLKANKLLDWKAMTSLDDAIKSAWEWEKKIRTK